MSGAHAVEIEGVTKTFGKQVAVDDLSLAVPEGVVYGFIGPNGSGKTTTLRMITRIYHPDRGRIRILGEERWSAVNDRVAYLPEERGLYKQMTVRDVLAFYAALKGVSDAKPAIDRWLERLGLAAHGDKRVASLSKGMSQKVQFIATVIASPKLVLLDEPFSGLDPVNAVVLREAILELKKTATVIFSTHDMEIAERMCDAIFMIFRGKKVLDGTLEQIQDAHGEDTIRVKLDGSPSLGDLPGVSAVTDFGKLQQLRIEPGTDPQRILAELVKRGTVRHFELARPSLQEIFVRIARPELDAPHA
ncbi:MAG: ATP-binding cassette domain-containing protein [Labilithrix sp.]|nr:ATP-binding cassette domain-containing protein [Labilithrix sp.]MCW5812320.1 ATP-binding cassette domain-containing protein [Labilithrix sp.]